MAWRKWNVILIVLLANYVVFGLLGAFVFPSPPVLPLSHVSKPTFTPAVIQLRYVSPLTYDQLTPSPTLAPTFTPTAIPATATPTAPATTAPTVAATPLGGATLPPR